MKISTGVLNDAASSQYSTSRLNAVNAHTTTVPITRSGLSRLEPGAGLGLRGGLRRGGLAERSRGPVTERW